MSAPCTPPPSHEFGSEPPRSDSGDPQGKGKGIGIGDCVGGMDFVVTKGRELGIPVLKRQPGF